MDSLPGGSSRSISSTIVNIAQLELVYGLSFVISLFEKIR